MSEPPKLSSRRMLAGIIFGCWSAWCVGPAYAQTADLEEEPVPLIVLGEEYTEYADSTRQEKFSPLMRAASASRLSEVSSAEEFMKRKKRRLAVAAKRASAGTTGAGRRPRRSAPMWAKL